MTNTESESKGSNNLWDLDYYKFLNTGVLIFAVSALFEVMGNQDLQLHRDQPLSFGRGIAFPFNANQDLQLALSFFVLAIALSSAALLMDLFGRRGLERQPDVVADAILSKSTFEWWLNTFSALAGTFLSGGLTFRLAAIHNWYGVGFVAVVVAIGILLILILRTLPSEISKAKEQLVQTTHQIETNRTRDELASTLIVGALIFTVSWLIRWAKGTKTR
jgi:hypothetical protein